MTKEDLEFLKELQHEMQTQDNDGQAAPRFWGIVEVREQIVPDDYGDVTKIIDRTWEPEAFTLEEYVDFIDARMSDEPDLADMWKKVKRDDMTEVTNFAGEVLGMKPEITEFKREFKLSDQTGCFLTKRAVAEHIRNNSHHYCNPHTFCMTAWRNPEFERFIKIFENLDLEKLESVID